jgi:hypothetical protein
MSKGLSIGLDEFRSLPSKKKLDCLYENLGLTICAIDGYKFHQKIQYPWLIVLTGAAIFILEQAVRA